MMFKAFAYGGLPVEQFEGFWWTELTPYDQQTDTQRRVSMLLDQRDHESNSAHRAAVADKIRICCSMKWTLTSNGVSPSPTNPFAQSWSPRAAHRCPGSHHRALSRNCQALVAHAPMTPGVAKSTRPDAGRKTHISVRHPNGSCCARAPRLVRATVRDIEMSPTESRRPSWRGCQKVRPVVSRREPRSG